VLIYINDNGIRLAGRGGGVQETGENYIMRRLVIMTELTCNLCHSVLHLS
jgi:hypothetical protein